MTTHDTDRLAALPCPVCGDDTVIRLPDDWQAQVDAGAAIPIVGCGNPWHYAGVTLAAPAEGLEYTVSKIENTADDWWSVVDGVGEKIALCGETDARMIASALNTLAAPAEGLDRMAEALAVAAESAGWDWDLRVSPREFAAMMLVVLKESPDDH